LRHAGFLREIGERLAAIGLNEPQQLSHGLKTFFHISRHFEFSSRDQASTWQLWNKYSLHPRYNCNRRVHLTNEETS